MVSCHLCGVSPEGLLLPAILTLLPVLPHPGNRGIAISVKYLRPSSAYIVERPLRNFWIASRKAKG